MIAPRQTARHVARWHDFVKFISCQEMQALVPDDRAILRSAGNTVGGSFAGTEPVRCRTKAAALLEGPLAMAGSQDAGFQNPSLSPSCSWLAGFREPMKDRPHVYEAHSGTRLGW